ncbi:hypothetical protein [Oryza sativa Japonica Group]|uniref:Uncharacterized protein n=1 Tax=Oryza sativa subsp. japonica TaxID=39947 RepID=Q5SNE6_ORYSJ|nr:hypothetical protein [Oryza sativa Japonica Group]BAD72268.1 hypothetical protein [Oryza sativa Japonica Group]
MAAHDVWVGCGSHRGAGLPLLDGHGGGGDEVARRVGAAEVGREEGGEAADLAVRGGAEGGRAMRCWLLRRRRRHGGALRARRGWRSGAQCWLDDDGSTDSVCGRAEVDDGSTASGRFWRVKKVLNLGLEQRLRDSIAIVHDFVNASSGSGRSRSAAGANLPPSFPPTPSISAASAILH